MRRWLPLARAGWGPAGRRKTVATNRSDANDTLGPDVDCFLPAASVLFRCRWGGYTWSAPRYPHWSQGYLGHRSVECRWAISAGESGYAGMSRPRLEDERATEMPVHHRSPASTMLKALLREKHLQNYGMFRRSYEKAAAELDKELVKTYPSEQTFRRWLAGRIKHLPRAEHCAVLEAMLPGWTVADLFKPHVQPGEIAESTLLRDLLHRRHLHDYRTFCHAYNVAAALIDKSLVGSYPAEQRFHQWITGDMIGLPYPDHCNVLEALFPGYSARQLFEPRQDDSPNGDGDVEAAEHSGPPKTRAAFPGSLTLQEACEPPSIAAIRAISDSFQLADRKLGGGLLYESVMRYIRSEISPSLLDPPRDCSSSDLFSAAASLTEVAGWMAHDGGNDDKSKVHFGQAYHLAVAAENPVLCANVCASLSHLAIQLGQAEDAARISSAGLSRACHGDGTEQLVGRLHAMRARAAAIQGKEKDCRRALEAAYESLDNYGGSSPARWIARFDEASLGSESALCFYALGALKEAENEARKVIELRRMSDRVRSRAFGQLTLANVLLKAGAVEEAAAVGAEICTVAHSLNSARVRSALAQLGQSLDTGPAVPEVEFFLDRLAELTEASVISHHQERWPL